LLLSTIACSSQKREAPTKRPGLRPPTMITHVFSQRNDFRYPSRFDKHLPDPKYTTKTLGAFRFRAATSGALLLRFYHSRSNGDWQQ
jgi:hypothetical protein